MNMESIDLLFKVYLIVSTLAILIRCYRSFLAHMSIVRGLVSAVVLLGVLMLFNLAFYDFVTENTSIFMAANQ
ncbi:hypothetical protein [Algivirga pacifica]|uniref:Uncharacterized protein n=1 Tax=Algivirga pacifica TaxID=1162670 RepID=A0ABP9DCS8_9BACT